MKRVIKIFIICVMLIGLILLNYSYASGETYTLDFEVSNANESFDLYVLLPKEYILFAIQEDGLNIEYTGADTLKNNNIPSISVNKNDIEDKLYEENGIEYTQIHLKENSQDKYEFDILADYPDRDMKFRVKNTTKDYIIHIDNFEVKNGICKVEYDYMEESVKQEGTEISQFIIILLIVILIALIVVTIIAYNKQKEKE